MSTCIEYKGKLFLFNAIPNLTEAMFMDRCWYIVKNINEPNIEELADLWISKKYTKCQYDELIMTKLNDLERNVF
jgi:hypothetical protein